MLGGHIARFKIGVLKVQDFGNCELSPMFLSLGVKSKENIKMCSSVHLSMETIRL